MVVTRVHDLIHQGKLPKNLITKNIWDIRYRQIRDWERYLGENGFHMINSNFAHGKHPVCLDKSA